MQTCIRTFELITDLGREGQRDIFAIIVNMLSMDESCKNEYEDFCQYLLDLTVLEKSDTIQLLIQKRRIKLNYELIILDELSTVGKKYLNFLLEYISQTTKSKTYKAKIKYIISYLFYEDEIKKNIGDYVSNCIDTNGDNLTQNSKLNKVCHDRQNKIIKELGSTSLTSIIKTKSSISRVKDKIIEVTALSPEDGDYGIKFLTKTRSDTIHIFINGFTNDNQEVDNYKEWLKEAKDLINQNDIFCGFDWPCGKDILYHVKKSIFPPPITLKGIGGKVIELSFRTVSEWKNARNKSKDYSEYLAHFIEAQHKKNPDIKINLYGHSLGANLIRYTLEHLYEKDIKIEDVFLLGGASDNNELSWTNYRYVANNIYNFYSEKDQILKKLFQSIEWECPIGLNCIQHKDINELGQGNLYNYDVSNTISGHTEYIKNFSSLYGYKYRNEQH